MKINAKNINQLVNFVDQGSYKHAKAAFITKAIDRSMLPDNILYMLGKQVIHS